MSPKEERRNRTAALAPIRRLARRVNTAVALSSLVGPMWAVVTAIALWRFAVQRWVPPAAALLTSIGALAAWHLMRPKLLNSRQAAVMADRRIDAGGLLLTHLETEIGAWEVSLEALVERLTPPPLAIGRSAVAISLALLFLVAAMTMPLPSPLVRPPNAAAVGRVEELAQKLDAVAEEEPVEAELRQELERLREEVKQGKFDSADWEAADLLDKDLDRRAEEGGSELLEADEAAQKLALAMDDGRTLEALTRERDQLEQALMQLSDGNAENGDQALSQTLERGAPSPTSPRNPALDEEQRGEPQGKEGTQEQKGRWQNGPSQKNPPQNGQPQEGRRGDKSTSHPPARQPSGEPRATGSLDKGEQGTAEGRQGPTRTQLEELQRTLEERRNQLAKSFGQEGGQRAPKGNRSQRPIPKGHSAAQNGKVSSSGEPGSEGHDEAGEAKELVSAGRAEMDPGRLAIKPLPEGSGGDGTDLWGLVAANPAQKNHGKVNAGSGHAATGEETPANREGGYLPRNRALIRRYFDSPK